MTLRGRPMLYLLALLFSALAAAGCEEEGLLSGEFYYDPSVTNVDARGMGVGEYPPRTFIHYDLQPGTYTLTWQYAGQVYKASVILDKPLAESDDCEILRFDFSCTSEPDAPAERVYLFRIEGSRLYVAEKIGEYYGVPYTP